MEKILCYATEIESENTSNLNFSLHSHDEYEIFMFLEGDSKYVVEGKMYSLTPGDIIIIRKHEMHRVFHNTTAKYHRFVLMVYPEFFEENNCLEYEKPFLDSGIEKGNKINAEDVYSSGLYDAIIRFKKYSGELKNFNTPVVKSNIVEILYLINKITSYEKADEVNGTVNNIITYINSNYTEDISLEDIAEKFFLSKYHLCRIFKKATGLTIHKYISRKRLTRAYELKKEGMNLTKAATLAGFKDYSSFYRASVKLNKK